MGNPLEISVYREWIETIIDEREESLSDSERTFLTDMENKLLRDETITEAMHRRLSEMYVKTIDTLGHGRI